jgi:serine/threonine protein kinase
LEEYYELHRRDAVAMDHLTFSPFVMNVYGYCGQSAINELADFKPEINALEQLDRRLRGQHSNNILVLKLRLAMSVSIGLYHVHYGIPGMPWEHTNTTRSMRPSMAHYDINPRNIAIVQGGKPKLNDFNIAEFLRYPQENSTADTCGFPSRLHEPWWRAPEEMHTDSTTTTTTMINEKVDIYSLGAVLFHILTTHAPRGKMKKERMEGVRVEVEQGIRPTLMEPFASDPSPIVQAFRDAMDLCFHEDPRKRGTSGEVATILYRAMEVAAEADEKGKHDIHDKPHKKKPHERHA